MPSTEEPATQGGGWEELLLVLGEDYRVHEPLHQLDVEDGGTPQLLVYHNGRPRASLPGCPSWPTTSTAGLCLSAC